MRSDQLISGTVAALLALSLVIPPAWSEDNPTPPEHPAAPAPESAPATAPAAVTILNKHEVEGVLGREVLSAANENMGRIADVLVDRGGQVRAAIIDFGGFLGVGSRKIAVDWALFQFKPGNANGPLVLPLDRARVQAAPEYKAAAQQPVPIVAAPARNDTDPADGK
jgi:hypothetical protein